MAAITATNSATISLQSQLNQSRLEQARRAADVAETSAKALRSQANAAEQDAQQRQNNVRTLSAELAKSNVTYAPMAKGAASEVPLQTQEFLLRLYRASSQKFASAGNALKTNPNSAPIINSQGQPTGRIVNIAA